MGLAEVDEALRLVADRPDRSFFAGERPPALLAAAERALGLSFPPSYRAFLRRLGAGNVGASELYGVIDDNFTDSAVPDGIWMTLRGREAWGLPRSMVVVYGDGFGGYFVLDTAKTDEDGECPVLVWQPGRSERSEELEFIAPDFGSFFLETARRALET